MPAFTTTPIGLVCPECGTIKKSGKLSCCGRGGSWYGNCGSAGNMNLGHTWQEGIRVCKDRHVQAVVLHTLQSKQNASSDDANVALASITVDAFAFIPATTLTSLPLTTPMAVIANKPITTSAQTSVSYDTGRPMPQAVTETIHTPVSMSTSTTTIPPANLTMIKWVRSALTDISMTTSSQTSASTSVTAQECEKLLHVVTHISMTLITVCWY